MCVIQGVCEKTLYVIHIMYIGYLLYLSLTFLSLIVVVVALGILFWLLLRYPTPFAC